MVFKNFGFSGRSITVRVFLIRMGYKVEAFGKKITNVQFPNRLKGTIFEKWADYWKAVGSDYAEVARDTSLDVKKKPLKYSIYAAAAGFVAMCAALSPDDDDYRDTLVKYCNELTMVGEQVRNPSAVNYLKLMESMFNEGAVRVYSLGICSILWRDDFHEQLMTYRATCTYLKPPVSSYQTRILDVGFLRRWWVLENVMKDFDVNPNEWNGNDKAEPEITEET